MSLLWFIHLRKALFSIIFTHNTSIHGEYMAGVSRRDTNLLITGYGVPSMEAKGLQPVGMSTDRTDCECAFLRTAMGMRSFPGTPYPVISNLVPLPGHSLNSYPA